MLFEGWLPIVGKNTNFKKRLQFSTLEVFDFLDRGGHGISLSGYQNHFVMVFELTYTQEASHDFIHPELTNGSISVELTFARALADKI